jgi:hypothetical protein
MSAHILQTTTSSPTIGRVVRSWLSGLFRASREAWIDYRSARSPADRRHRLGLFVLYLSAVILPGGALLILLRWLWLRLHM